MQKHVLCGGTFSSTRKRYTHAASAGSTRPREMPARGTGYEGRKEERVQAVGLREMPARGMKGGVG